MKKTLEAGKNTQKKSKDKNVKKVFEPKCKTNLKKHLGDITLCYNLPTTLEITDKPVTV